MCVVAFAWQAHPRWRLVAIGNRDELHARPAAPLALWPESGIIAGRDLQSGGTWLGVSDAGRFVVVTNLRGYGPPQPDRASRGALVADLLSGQGRYADPETAALADFNPFNLMMAGQGQAQFLTNRPETIRTRLATGLYGLSNGALDEPWPKTLQLKTMLLEWIVAGSDDIGPLLAGLHTEALPDFGLAPAGPSDVAQEPSLSPIFIRNPVYGTRCSTVVTVDAGGRGTITERRYDAAGEAAGDTTIAFSWPG